MESNLLVEIFTGWASFWTSSACSLSSIHPLDFMSPPWWVAVLLSWTVPRPFRCCGTLMSHQISFLSQFSTMALETSTDQIHLVHLGPLFTFRKLDMFCLPVFYLYLCWGSATILLFDVLCDHGSWSFTCINLFGFSSSGWYWREYLFWLYNLFTSCGSLLWYQVRTRGTLLLQVAHFVHRLEALQSCNQFLVNDLYLLSFMQMTVLTLYVFLYGKAYMVCQGTLSRWSLLPQNQLVLLHLLEIFS